MSKLKKGKFYIVSSSGDNFSYLIKDGEILGFSCPSDGSDHNHTLGYTLSQRRVTVWPFV